MSKPSSYYAVIFTSIRTEVDEGYTEMAARMEQLAKQQVGFIGIESARDVLGITISYWDTVESIRAWKQQVDHLIAQQFGKGKWYSRYTVRICKVEREYSFEKGE